jgi:hypothetical protein
MDVGVGVDGSVSVSASAHISNLQQNNKNLNCIINNKYV